MPSDVAIIPIFFVDMDLTRLLNPHLEAGRALENPTVGVLASPVAAERSMSKGDGSINYVHEEEIWKQRLEEEWRGDAEWHRNWGFLAKKEMSKPRGFSTNVASKLAAALAHTAHRPRAPHLSRHSRRVLAAEYAYGGNKWTISSVRVPDNTPEGVSAAVSERDARKTMSSLTWATKNPTITKPCEAKGAYTGMTRALRAPPSFARSRASVFCGLS